MAVFAGSSPKCGWEWRGGVLLFSEIEIGIFGILQKLIAGGLWRAGGQAQGLPLC